MISQLKKYIEELHEKCISHFKDNPLLDKIDLPSASSRS